MSSDQTADLLTRLLVDGEFRAAFRRDPQRVCRELALADLADALPAQAGFQTLEIRESRSGLAGVLAALAVEGIERSTWRSCSAGWTSRSTSRRSSRRSLARASSRR